MSRQIKSQHREMTRNVRCGGNIWVCIIFLDKPATPGPSKTCMGSGKEPPKYGVAFVNLGRMIYEMI
ncbi:50S/60S RIBOSOMAL PROTEIN L16 [Salix purpurea]|uniref:50S/60S RIBOSOMAL PROTEIN L16 n=1 Tax=Salix purpurea TaxID=77065 RepID=A0A9Q0PCB9_SALPP|nr:50S/60S RIBOSOMAL PROTEIN L16 [Salix purpurea]